LGDVGLPGSAAEAAGIDDGAEVAKLVDFHRLCLSSLSELYIGTMGRGRIV
jgi:hypothetical protein